MAEALKNFFGPEVPARIAAMITAVHPSFDAPAFTTEASDGLDSLELLPRAWHIAHALHRHLPQDFETTAGILGASLEPRPAVTDGNMASFLFLPHVLYVAHYGIDWFEPAMRLQYELTKRFTAEFSIRDFIERYPEQTLARLRVWARDPDAHVRRLVSEGTRPRLPWAKRLRRFQADPHPVLELLEMLKDDPELYVRRSVANNLNDIGKDHPGLLVETCRQWLIDAPEPREWLVKHALRSAVKRGDSGALGILGYGQAPSIRVERVTVAPERAAIGESVVLSFTITNTGEPQSLLIDFRVFYVKSDGTTSPKVFKLTAADLAAGESVTLKKTISLRQMTTRKHYPGNHAIDVIVNGVPFPAGTFMVTEARPLMNHNS